ncbi:MAG: hypothetical protein IOD05_08780 [Rhodobacter sp.]|nr:hypothetical protein [Rhodobacter sp.]
MAKDLGNGIDLTISAGLEALATAETYTPPSRYNYTRPPFGTPQYFAWQEAVADYITEYNKDKPPELQKLHPDDFGSHDKQMHHLFPVGVVDDNFKEWVEANFDSFDINDPQWIVIAPTTIAGQKHIENTKGKFVALHSGGDRLHDRYDEYIGRVRDGLTQGASAEPTESQRTAARRLFGDTMQAIRQGIVSTDKRDVIFALNLNDSLFLERNRELLVQTLETDGLSRSAAEAKVERWISGQEPPNLTAAQRAALNTQFGNSLGSLKTNPSSIDDLRTKRGIGIVVGGDPAANDGFLIVDKDTQASFARVVSDVGGAGSAALDLTSIALLAYGVSQKEGFEDITAAELVALLRNSNVSGLIAETINDDLLLNIAFEVIASALASALGVGLLWKAYEIYQSLGALTAALEFASRHSDNAVIDNLQGLVSSVKVRLDQWFGAGETPAYQDIANLIVEEFPVAEQTLIRDAILDFAVALGVASGLPRSDLPSDTVVSALQLLENITLDLGLEFNTVVQFALMAKPALVWGDALSRSMFDIERSAETMDALDRALAGPEMFAGYSVILAPSLAFLGTADPEVWTEVLDWMAAIITTAAGSLAGGAAPDTAAHLGYITVIPASDRDNDGNSETTDVIRAAAALTRDYGAGHAGITQAMAALTQALVTRTGLLLDTMDLAAVPESAALEVVTARARQLMVLADIWGQTNRSLGQTLAKGVAGLAVALARKAQEGTVSTVGAAEALIDQAVIIAQELRALQGVDPTQDVRMIATQRPGQRGKVSMIPKITHRKSVAHLSRRSRRLVADGRKRHRGGWGGQPMAPEPQPGVCA